MSRFAITLQCSNPECLYAENQIGQPTCDRCQSPLTYRYLWATGVGAAQIAIGSLIDCRYAVISSQIWLDTQPSLPPKQSTLPNSLLTTLPATLPPSALPYLKLYPQRFHIPDLFAVYQPDETVPPILLLSNGPIDAPGQLQPLLEAAWSSAPAVRQLNWLWQLLHLWQPLKTQGVVSSLLTPDNLYVEGWRVRLRELILDRPVSLTAELAQAELASSTAKVAVAIGGSGVAVHPPQVHSQLHSQTPAAPLPFTPTGFGDSAAPPCFNDLAELWQLWIETAQPEIQTDLRQLCQELRSLPDTDRGIQTVADRLNTLLLSQAARTPLRLEIAGASTTGPQRSHNEDACFPNSSDPNQIDPVRLRQLGLSELLPYVGMVCDGIGGHEGGEVASQVALRTLQLQLRTWLTELTTQPEALPPQIIEQQLTEIVRVVNNLIAGQNNLQKRAQRQRMGTTLMMAVQAPQKVKTPQGEGNSHELYLVHVGDSRAYWLTPHACQPLTIDDDVTSREVRSGRSLLAEASQRSDATALTQALGTREGDQLKVTVQRHVVDEDGILLLCSDGVSDNGLVEQFWDSMTPSILAEKLTLEDAVDQWLELANRHNGHDNASIVLLHCRVSSPLRLIEFPATESTLTQPEVGMTESAKALLYDSENQPTFSEDSPKAAVLPKEEIVDRPPQKMGDRWLMGLGAAALMFILGALSIAIWRELAPTGFAPRRSAPPAAIPETVPETVPETAPEAAPPAATEELPDAAPRSSASPESSSTASPVPDTTVSPKATVSPETVSPETVSPEATVDPTSEELPSDQLSDQPIEEPIEPVGTVLEPVSPDLESGEAFVDPAAVAE